MPASDLFTITGGSYTDYTDNIEKRFISFQLLGSVGSSITFKQNLITYFTVIGGGGGGGGGGHDSGIAPYPAPAYPSGGGGGAGASGKVSFRTNLSESYSYVVGSGGGRGKGNNNGGNGTRSSITFNPGTEYIYAEGGNYGAGHFGSNVGGTGGPLTIQGLDTIISGTSGDGGNGVQYNNIGIPGNGTSGTAQNPTSIEINPDISINVGGGGGGADATSLIKPPDPPYQGGRGGNGTGGPVGSGIVIPGPTTVSDGEKGQTYGAGGGGGGQPGVGTRLGDNSYNISWGGVGGDGAIFVYIVDVPTNGCEWNPNLAAETTEWTRAHTDCVDLDGATLNGKAMTYNDLNEKRKATIFQYKKNSAGFSKKQQYSRIARGLGQKKTTYATQSATYTNPNTNNLVLDASSVLLCPGRAKNWAFTSQNDTPGPMRKITNEPTVPLTNYIVRRTYLAGNNKWPQLGPLDPNPNSSSSSSSSPSSLLLPTVKINTPANNSTIYNNRIQIDYVTDNFVNDYYIKILVNNVVLNVVPDEKIYPLSLTYDLSSLVIDTNTDNNYNIKLLTYTNKNIPFPATDQITVNVLVPTISITYPLNDATINSNVFDLFYNVTNKGDNKIVLYNGTTLIDDNVTKDPYPVKVDTSDSYDFKLKIVNDIIAPDPDIIINISNIKMEIPTVEITHPVDIPTFDIVTNTFDLSYNVVNMPASSHLQLYNRKQSYPPNTWNDFDMSQLAHTIGTSIVVPNPDTTEAGIYEYKLQINDIDNISVTDVSISNIIAVSTHTMPHLTVNNASRDVSGNYIFYYFKQATWGSFTLQYTDIIPLTQPIDILLVGGGGCGGFDGGYWGSGGGGAGAYVTGDIDPSNNVLYNITIGDGAYGVWPADGVAGNGDKSFIITQDGTTIVEAYGGGRGGDNPETVNGGQGTNFVGSGGGGSGDGTGVMIDTGNIPGFKGTPAGLGGTVYASRGGYGNTQNKSTNQWDDNPRRGGGGGGGAGGTGGVAPDGWIGGNGGDGKQWKDDVWYGGGGAGQGVNDRNNENYGGKGGGGNGGQPGGANTGGGGGAGQGSNPGSGGSGICVIRLLTNSFIQDDSSIIIT